jgi:hypothetical protein
MEDDKISKKKFWYFKYSCYLCIEKFRNIYE